MQQAVTETENKRPCTFACPEERELPKISVSPLGILVKVGESEPFTCRGSGGGGGGGGDCVMN